MQSWKEFFKTICNYLLGIWEFFISELIEGKD